MTAAREYEKANPAEIQARIRAGHQVRLWDHNGDHSKVLRVDTSGNIRLGVDSANATIWVQGGGGREVPVRVNTMAAVKVVKDAAPAPHIPQSGDAVEAWLTDWICELKGNVVQANAVRAMRDDYRAHARHGTPLDQDIPAPPPDAAREALASRVQPVADAQQDRDGAA